VITKHPDPEGVECRVAVPFLGIFSKFSRSHALTVLLVCLFTSGCTGPSETSSKVPIPKPGSGIAEYREIARQAHTAVARTLNYLEGLERPKATATQPVAFDRALEDLELTSIKARARAEAIIARGQKYFDEWQEQMGTNHPAAQADYNRLFAHFTLVRERSAEVRAFFRPFMAGLRQFRATLDPLDPVKPDDPAGTRPPANPAPVDIKTVTAGGRRVLKTLESVSAALNDAEAELKTMLASKR